MTVEEKRRAGNGVEKRPDGALVLPTSPPKVRYSEGWRAGKPEEDPHKTKKWGFVAAKPSEFLIRMRGGTVVTSGQGASCFKWPWDSVAIIPTTVQRLQFTADQITSEKVGVQVTGLAVYRIAEPMIAFRMLNFSFPERAQEKLEEMLVEMFVGAVRRLVANLSVEQCLTRRKEGLASELMREIAPVVSGIGRPDDRTQKGWGVVIDTIEIQDVRVLSGAVFANMQARFRQEQERLAREAVLAKERAVKLNEAEAQRLIELSRLQAETDIREKQQEANERAQLEELASAKRVSEARLEQQRALEQAKLANERELNLARLTAELELAQKRQEAQERSRLEQLAAEARLAEAKLMHERAVAQSRMQAEIERVRLEAEQAAARHEAAMAEQAHEAERAQAQAQVAQAKLQIAELELRSVELETRKQALLQELELGRQRALREIENSLSPEVIQLAVANKLPELAAAFQQKMGEVHVTAVDGANPFGYIAAALQGVLGVARSVGLELPKKDADEKLA